jgi:hypothetical protein
MKVYEVVKDHQSGRTKVMVREERRPTDPLAGENLRRLDLERRARMASLKSWWIALRYAWRDRAQRMKIAGHVFFFAALLVVPLAYAAVAVIGQAIRQGVQDSPEKWYRTAVLLVLILGLVAGLAVRSAARKLFGREP